MKITVHAWSEELIDAIVCPFEQYFIENTMKVILISAYLQANSNLKGKCGIIRKYF